MTKRTREEMAKVFAMLHKPGSSSYSVARANRVNSDEPYAGQEVCDIFDEILDKQFDVVEEVHKKFGA